MPNSRTITVEDSINHVVQQTIKTDGYMILYLENDKIKSVGDLDIKSLTPILMKIAMEKLVK